MTTEKNRVRRYFFRDYPLTRPGDCVISDSARILVTGSSGFLGRHLCSSLAARLPAAQVIACDLRQASAALAENILYFELDVRDPAACLRLFRDLQPTHILHAAAVTAADNSSLLQEVNVGGTEHVLDAAMFCGSVQLCLVISSSAVYGNRSDTLWCDESHPLDVRADYAESKWRSEQTLAAREAQSGIPMLAARVGPCYGPGEGSGPFRPRISMIGTLSAALHEKRPVRIAGSDYNRDWTHLDDVSAALSLLLMTPSPRHRLYNVSSGVAVSARHIIRLFVDFGLEVEWMASEADARLPDLVLGEEQSRKPMVIDRLRADTGFRPVVTIAMGISTMLPAELPASCGPHNVL